VPNKRDLTVISVAANGCKMLPYMVESVKRFTPSLKEIIICDNGNNGNQLNAYSGDKSVRVVKNNPKMRGGSNRHGEGLNSIMPLVDTDRVAIIESDVAVFDEKWCDFDTSRYDVITPFKQMSDNKKCIYVCFVIMNRNHCLNIDFRPGDDITRKYRSYLPHEDAGWRIIDNLDEDRILWLGANKCESKTCKYFDSTFNYKSFEIYRDGDINNVIAAHFYRGSDINVRPKSKQGLSPSQQVDIWIDVLKKIIK